MSKNNKFTNEDYTVSVLGKNFQVTDAIRDYIWEKISRIEKVAGHIIEITVTLDTQKLEHVCSIFMNFIHFPIKVTASTDNIYSAIDKASDKAVKLIRRYKTKLQSHRAKHMSVVDIHVNVIKPLSDDLKEINDEIEEETAHRQDAELKLHEIVAKETIPLKTFTEGEALMKMEISDDPLLIYRSEEDQKMKVIYRREDLNYSLVSLQ